MSTELPNHGSPFAETETLIAALDGNPDEVAARVAAMYPSERRLLITACSTVSFACADANREAKTR